MPDSKRKWYGQVSPKATSPFRELHKLDENLASRYESSPRIYEIGIVEAESEEEAKELCLDKFHSTTPVKVLDDFEFRVRVDKVMTYAEHDAACALAREDGTATSRAYYCYECKREGEYGSGVKCRRCAGSGATLDNVRIHPFPYIDCPTCKSSSRFLDDGTFEDPHARISFLENVLEARERTLDRIEGDFNVGLSEKPENILKYILGIDTIENMTVEFGKVEKSGRIHVRVVSEDGTIVKDRVTAAIAPDALDREIALQAFGKRVTEVSEQVEELAAFKRSVMAERNGEGQ